MPLLVPSRSYLAAENPKRSKRTTVITENETQSVAGTAAPAVEPIAGFAGNCTARDAQPQPELRNGEWDRLKRRRLFCHLRQQIHELIVLDLLLTDLRHILAPRDRASTFCGLKKSPSQAQFAFSPTSNVKRTPSPLEAVLLFLNNTAQIGYSFSRSFRGSKAG